MTTVTTHRSGSYARAAAIFVAVALLVQGCGAPTSSSVNASASAAHANPSATASTASPTASPAPSPALTAAVGTASPQECPTPASRSLAARTSAPPRNTTPWTGDTFMGLGEITAVDADSGVIQGVFELPVVVQTPRLFTAEVLVPPGTHLTYQPHLRVLARLAEPMDPTTTTLAISPAVAPAAAGTVMSITYHCGRVVGTMAAKLQNDVTAGARTIVLQSFAARSSFQPSSYPIGTAIVYLPAEVTASSVAELSAKLRATGLALQAGDRIMDIDFARSGGGYVARSPVEFAEKR